MNTSIKKRWTSLDEMYQDLKSTDDFKYALQKNSERNLLSIVTRIEDAISARELFDCTCLLSSEFDSLKNNEIEDIFRKTNIYVLVLNAVFRNQKFISTLTEILTNGKKFNEYKTDELLLEKYIFINTALSLAFFPISVNYQSFSVETVEFLRKNSSDLIKNILKQSIQKIDFVKTCSVLEKISWNNEFHFNFNFESKYPVKLKDDFLFSHLKTSRSFCGIVFTSLSIRPSIEAQFKKSIQDIKSEDFSITKCLDSIFYLTNNIQEKINHYYRKASKDVTNFFDIFINNNEKNLVYCFKSFCEGFHYQEGKKFYEIILNKIRKSSAVKANLKTYIQTNLGAFTGNLSPDKDEWTNKVFLISIKTLSIFEEISSAKDEKWILRVAIRELREWILQEHEVLNKYYIEDDWEKIESLTKQENVEIEWKSSLYIPTESPEVLKPSKEMAGKVFDSIVKAVLGLLNTNGGTLLVGLIENPEKVKNQWVKERLLQKNGLTFFDISEELKLTGKNIDQIRLQLLDKLTVITDTTADQFNTLLSIEPIKLQDDEKFIFILKINVKKGNKLFYTCKNEEGKIWVSLTRRAEGQTISVDPRSFLV